MQKTTYNFAVGALLIIVSLVFFFAPGFIRMDATIPFMFALVAFVLGISFFFMGRNQNDSKKSRSDNN